MIFIQSIIIFICSNIYSISMLKNYLSIPLLLAALIVILLFNIFPTLGSQPTRKLKRIQNGVRLLEVFLIVFVLDILWIIFCLFFGYELIAFDYAVNTIAAAVVLLVIFLNGITKVYISSSQLGLKWRLAGIIWGWVPIANIYILYKIIKISAFEYKTEGDKIRLNLSRAADRICETKYPILLVHGVFFRDFRFFNYWGRIPEELIKNGASVYYGNQQSAASVAECGREIAARIKEITEESGKEKVNIIAHSKGGLDSRYAISLLGADKYVASLTTVNTPHRGCQFADFLLNLAPKSLKDSVSDKYNRTLKKLGDHNPDFISAVSDLTAESCAEFNKKCKNAEGVYYQSIGSKSVGGSGSRFPLNLCYHFVKLFDGDNDGLVSVDSMNWGERFTFLQPEKKRGISHGDMIDLNRENIDGFDVREAYVDIVRDLKERGL